MGIVEVDERSHRARAFCLADVAAQGLFEDGGHSNAVHAAEAQLEMPARRARELIRVGRELRGRSDEVPGTDLSGLASQKSLNANHRTVHATLDDESDARFEKTCAFFLERSGREKMTDGELLKAMTQEIAGSHPELKFLAANNTPVTRPQRAAERSTHPAIAADARHKTPPHNCPK